MGLLLAEYSALLFVLLSLRFLLSPPSFHHSCGPSHSLNPSLCPPGVFVFSPLPSLALSGSGPVIRPRTPVRALPTPKQQLALQGEAGECVRLPLCLLAVICLSVCPLTNCSILVVLHLETSEHWVVFSSRKQRTPFVSTLLYCQNLRGL